ncbi:MAG: hypothetical protein JRF30_04945 [Deltaproteobacteria bacterium]|nr:hypothetical protein [Deltaproteobacteria bacterium]
MKQGNPLQERVPIVLFKIGANPFGVFRPQRWVIAKNNLDFLIGAHDMLKDIVSVVIKRAITA